MTAVSRGALAKTLLNSSATGLLSFYADCCSAIRGLACRAGLAHADTCRHTHGRISPSLLNRTFAAMAQPSSGLQLAESAQHPAAALPQSQQQQQQQQQSKAQPAQALQQGFSIPTGPASGPSPAGFKKTFYKRKLPCPPAIEFSSPEGRQLFQEALLQGSMTGFFKLMEQFNTQDEPAFCGLASLAMVLNALSIDPRRTWKGSWRWFHEAMLDCCRPLEVVKEEGVTLYQASCLARCNGARVELRPYGSTSLEQFRQEVQAVCRSGEEHIVVSYSRKAFLQTGDGHFSPIGGYHSERDLALVLDVARFKYPPHWVPLPMLYHAMSYLDPETGRPRGYMRLASNPLLDSVLLTLDVRNYGWRPADSFVRMEAPALVKELAARGDLGPEDVVRHVVDAMPLASMDAFMVMRSGAPLAAAVLHPTTGAPIIGHAACAVPPPQAAADVAADPTAAATAAAVPCASPEAMAAAVVQAAAMGSAAATAAANSSNASAAAAAIATASTPTKAATPLTATGTGASSIGPSVAAVPGAPKCGGGGAGGGSTARSCGSGGCGSGGGGGAATAGSSCGTGHTLGHSSGGSSSVMAAAAAVFTAHDRCIPQAQRQQLLDELRGMPLYTLVARHLSAAASQPGLSPASSSSPPSSAAAPPGRYLVEKVVMALLMQQPEVWPAPEAWANPAAGAQWRALLGLTGYSVVEAEVSYLREQLQHIDEVLQSGDVDGTCGEHDSKLDCAAHGH